MRATWDAAAASPENHALFVGPPETALRELDGLFGRLGADPRGGVCVEVGCGPGRMTRYLAERFDRVVSVDVSSRMLEAAQSEVAAPNVEYRLVSGRRLDGVDDGIADALVCYLVMQHMPRRALVRAYLREFARVLAPAGQAFVQIPVLEGIRGRVWRAIRAAAVPFYSQLSPNVVHRRSYRGVRLTERELGRAIAVAGLHVAARDEQRSSPYRYARELYLRLERR
jgi:ubiquinone/menaquinone biosynthesis C-methylase UbiE